MQMKRESETAEKQEERRITDRQHRYIFHLFFYVDTLYRVIFQNHITLLLKDINICHRIVENCNSKLWDIHIITYQKTCFSIHKNKFQTVSHM